MSPEISESDIHDLAVRVGEALRARGLMLATAESCTGGWASMAVTAIAGSSAWFERGFVSYSNTAKQDMLGVRSAAQVGLAISGLAGRGGGSAAKPVGLVCLGWALQGGETRSRRLQCEGGREDVRRQAVAQALEGLIELLSASPESP
jgi:nicotinamide-nucleotide amidase